MSENDYFSCDEVLVSHDFLYFFFVKMKANCFGNFFWELRKTTVPEREMAIARCSDIQTRVQCTYRHGRGETYFSS